MPTSDRRSQRRASGTLNKTFDKNQGPPNDEGGWVWETGDRLNSPAHRGLSINARRLLDFLKLEHCKQGGRENGSLKAPYSQLTEYGICRSEICLAIEESELLGFVRCKRGLRVGVEREAHEYRLTWLPTRDNPYPTNDWKRITAGRAREIRMEIGERKARTRTERAANSAKKQAAGIQTKAQPQRKKKALVGQDIQSCSTSHTQDFSRDFDKSNCASVR